MCPYILTCTYKFLYGVIVIKDSFLPLFSGSFVHLNSSLSGAFSSTKADQRRLINSILIQQHEEQVSVRFILII